MCVCVCACVCGGGGIERGGKLRERAMPLRQYHDRISTKNKISYGRLLTKNEICSLFYTCVQVRCTTKTDNNSTLACYLVVIEEGGGQVADENLEFPRGVGVQVESI